MVVNQLQSVGTIRKQLRRLGFQGGWVEAMSQDGDELLLTVRGRAGRRYRFCFEGVACVATLSFRGFVHGAFVHEQPDETILDQVVVGRASGRAWRGLIQVSFIGEEELLEVVFRSLRVECRLEEASGRTLTQHVGH